MKILWCWRCKMEVPMLDDEEYFIVAKLYSDSFQSVKNGSSRDESIKPMLDYYKEITGFEETNPNAIMHHRIGDYGPPCENCGKPYRTNKASFCAACGHKRPVPQDAASNKLPVSFWEKLFGSK